jgi:flagellar motility protein MotE (MotC chaperone)
VKFKAPRLPLKRLRLIPAVMALGAVVLAVKAAGLVVDAQAQEQQTPQAASTPAPDQPAQAATQPDADDAETSSAQVDVLQSLAKRRAELDARERDLDMRGNLIAAAENRVDAKIASLKQLQSAIQALLVQRDDTEQKQIAALVKAYSAMPPKDAARIFDDLNEDVLLAVAGTMKPADLAPILAKMQSEPAQKLTVRLANRTKLTQAQNELGQTVLAGTAPAAAATPAPPPATPAADNAAPPAAPSPNAQTAAPAANGK